MTIFNDMGEITKTTGMAIAREINERKGGGKEIDVRRKIALIPEAMESLSSNDRKMFLASLKQKINEYEDRTLVEKIALVFQYTAIDVGYKVGDNWQYLLTRITNILKEYYGDMTITDIKLAFDMLIVGELNQFLPTDSRGNADTKHYQNFSAEYVCKVLNAYKRRQNLAISHAYEAVPRTQEEVTDTQIVQEKKFRKRICLETYLRYKYTGKLQCLIMHYVYEWLLNIGYAEDVVPTDEDRKRAYNDFKRRYWRGLENQYSGAFVVNQGIYARELEYDAKVLARDREIKRAFDQMIKDEIIIHKWL